ncbi:hypothetical protein QNO08_03305 [Arthrobacter sp. zg-Y820]|uniref:hypothetical protein n=1 Tax=unclassified Arthrobacter TaxID=235627 RepID=UPI001E2EDC0D|nr:MULTISPECIES: hypothetical protein [unclassified Arthrobacter]MCC9195363.1 hypothetical protein [Arthrobacter sp. zg-Y820]MDK1278222.1 hypothetical protein [Arthrobacter sp. zg.Y820]MDK1361301.1 hypothetical protein [Arthrobacter sp. zg-Y1219]WIB10103.1 hypothetical protein QNO08_03305 [Arthrobacter sp. zg-Y820]
MALTLVAWMVSGFLAFSCLSLAYSAWKQEAWLSGRSRMSLLVGLLEAATIAGIVRLVTQWSTGTVVVWVVAVAALAAAVAGLIIRWHDLPVRSRSAEIAAPKAYPESTGVPVQEDAGAPEPNPEAYPESAGVPTESGRTATATVLRSKSRKASRKKPKKEPGRATVAGHACLLAAVVGLSFVIG